jgi:hypothetical protein
MKMSKAMAAKEEKTTAIAALAMDFEADQGAGFEQADKDSYAVPFLAILQSNSPQCKKSDGKYVKGAEEGMLYETVGGTIYPGDVGLSVIPCSYRRAFVEWKPRNSGGGFVSEHDVAKGRELLATTSKKEDEGSKDFLPNGNILVDTRYHYVLIVLPDGSWKPALITMSSTQIKKSKHWMTVMDGIKFARADGSKFTPPMFSHQYRLTTVPEQKDTNSWFGWKVEIEKTIEDARLYAEAKSFRDAVVKGVVKTQPPEAESATEADVDF